MLLFFSSTTLSLSLSPTEILSAHADFAKTTGGTELEISHIGCTDHKPGFPPELRIHLAVGSTQFPFDSYSEKKKVNSGMP